MKLLAAVLVLSLVLIPAALEAKGKSEGGGCPGHDRSNGPAAERPSPQLVRAAERECREVLRRPEMFPAWQVKHCQRLEIP